MKRAPFVLVFAVLAFTATYAQDDPKPGTDSAPQTAGMAVVAGGGDSSLVDRGEASSPAVVAPAPDPGHTESFGVGGKFRYYLGETYFNPSFLTAPAFRAGIRMANPPGHFPTAYPADWRQGPGGFGRNYGDAMVQRVSFETVRFATGALLREDPRYKPSSSHNVFLRSLHAFGYTFINQSDGGHAMPAFSNFVGATAAGFVGNAYLPAGFDNVTHAGQRVTLQFAVFGAGNLYREFAPQMPKPLRIFIELIGR
jgi:hypothetical protein